MGRSGLHSSSLNNISFVSGTVTDHRPGQSGRVHGTLIARRSSRRLTLGLFHAKNERPGSHGGVTRADGVQVARELILSAKLKNIAGTLALTVLASEAAIGVLLSVSICNLNIRKNETL